MSGRISGSGPPGERGDGREVEAVDRLVKESERPGRGRRHWGNLQLAISVAWSIDNERLTSFTPSPLFIYFPLKYTVADFTATLLFPTDPGECPAEEPR